MIPFSLIGGMPNKLGLQKPVSKLDYWVSSIMMRLQTVFNPEKFFIAYFLP
jgi:hypothetical protein